MEELQMRIVLLPVDGHDNITTAIVERSYLTTLFHDKAPLIFEYDPIQVREAEKNIYGAIKAKKRARGRWLRKDAEVFSSEYEPEAMQACHDHARLQGLEEELTGMILMRDIPVSALQSLMRTIVSLTRDLETTWQQAVDVLFTTCLSVS